MQRDNKDAFALSLCLSLPFSCCCARALFIQEQDGTGCRNVEKDRRRRTEGRGMDVSGERESFRHVNTFGGPGWIAGWEVRRGNATLMASSMARDMPRQFE